MAIYDSYARRNRIALGVLIKRRQASIIFKLGVDSAKSSSDSILEIGPGDGYIAELSRLADFPYTAIEGSASVADKLRNNGFEVIHGYVPPIPAGLTNNYQCCFILHVLEHMKTPSDAAQIVSEIYNTLAPGGTVIVACPDYSRWGQYFYDCDYTHSYPVTRRRLNRLLMDQGFEIVRDTIYTGPLFGYIGIPISWIAKLLYWPLLDDLMGSRYFNDALNRGFLTFLPNLITIGRRPL